MHTIPRGGDHRLRPFRVGVMRGLQRADHGLFVTVCRRHLGGIAGSGRARGRPRGGPCPAASAGIAVTGVPAATPGYVHGTLPGTARGTARRGISVLPVPSASGIQR
jgi:hypothetical protein